MTDAISARPGWFVGAVHNGSEDQTSRFLEDGIWENGYEDGRYQELVRSMRPGDRIAIKSSFTKKHGLPFESHGHSVSVMAIKATGTVIENLDDGRSVRVHWSPFLEPREWFFYTNRSTVWRVTPGVWMTDALLSFAFDNEPQDIPRFCEEPFWRGRFGPNRFEWTAFYKSFADRLLNYSDRRGELVEAVNTIATRMKLGGTTDQYRDGQNGALRDICPFTTMGMFNRTMTVENRLAIAKELAELIGVKEEIPKSLDGVPSLNNMRAWFFGYEKDRDKQDIDKLWHLFRCGASLAEADLSDQREAFVSAYDAAHTVRGASWNLSIGLFWAQPWEFPSLDGNSRAFLTNRLQMQLPSAARDSSVGSGYLRLVDDLKTRFAEENYPVHNFPELSLAARRYRTPGETDDSSYVDAAVTDDHESITVDNNIQISSPNEPYDIDDILREGCFLPRGEIQRLLDRLRQRKNLILQGPPGTGKTWIAKRLAFVLMGERDEARVRAVQFHPNLSYEDFVRGWRPTGDGKLSLVDGMFMETIHAALSRPTEDFVVIIEEINRGNPAQIFGELLTLLEAGKRTPREALELCYPDADGVRRPVHVPENLFVIGTMNIADRSLALVDLAFRRRFAFVGLEPRLGSTWQKWVIEERGIDPNLAQDIEKRIMELNQTISEAFGRQFEIGHSYVTPTARLKPNTTREWFAQVVETEIRPLLDEYWFDAPRSAREAVDRLLKGW